jgi:NitT/TauT family transport system substrate-binding protein
VSLARRTAALVLAAALVVAGCSGGSTPSTPGGGSGASGAPSSTRLVVGLGFIPNVQFAPFYLAQRAGYYREVGLDVEFQNKIDPDLVTLIAQGSVGMGLSDGTSVIPAVSQGIPVRYVATIYAKFPNIVFARTTSGITQPADLKGKRIGTPGTYGSSWVMLQALLQKAGLTTSDVTIQTYPDFTPATAVARGQVDAATGFLNNEPIQLKQQGLDTTILSVDDIVPLPGNGLIVGEKTLETKRDALKAFVAATLRAQQEVAANPGLGLDAAIAAVPDLAAQRATQQAILAATITAWSNGYTSAHGPGAINPDDWTRSIAFMQSLPGHLLAKPVTADQIVSTDLLPSP